MERLKKIIKRIFFLSPWLTVLIAVPSFVFVFVMLGTGNDRSALSYLAYALSAYALAITVTGIADLVTAVRGGVRRLPVVQKVRSIPVGERYLSDAKFRSEVALYRGAAINLMDVAVKLFSGIWYRSVWFLSLAVYYLLLSVMRLILLRRVRKAPMGQDIPAELRSYRMCGMMLLMMDQALIGILVYMVYHDQGFLYPGILIYAMAAYTFYITITAIVHVIKFRKRGSPVLSAAKGINLTAALFSMLSLEAAMISQFGQGESAFRRSMITSSGGVVSIIVLGMAVYMIIHAGKELKKQK